jgi:hypothetical protein
LRNNEFGLWRVNERGEKEVDSHCQRFQREREREERGSGRERGAFQAVDLSHAEIVEEG